MRKHTKRKHHNPRSLLLRADLTPQQITSIGLMGWQTLDLIKRGKATVPDVHCLATCVNVCAVLFERGNGAEYGEIVADGLEAMRRIMARPKPLGDGEGLTALGKLLELYDAQVAAITQREFVDALLWVERAVGGR